MNYSGKEKQCSYKRANELFRYKKNNAQTNELMNYSGKEKRCSNKRANELFRYGKTKL